MGSYLVTNLVDIQQILEYGTTGNLDTTVIIPARGRIRLEIDDVKVEALKSKFANILAFRKL